MPSQPLLRICLYTFSDMVSLVPVGVEKPHCYVVPWDDYPSIQDISQSWASLQELLDTQYLVKMWVTCLRYDLGSAQFLRFTNIIQAYIFLKLASRLIGMLAHWKLSLNSASWSKHKQSAFIVSDFIGYYYQIKFSNQSIY